MLTVVCCNAHIREIVNAQATVMNVKMCCAKCEEKAKEECEEVEGKFMYLKSSSYFLIVSNV